jgi:hypothetical protein
MRVKIVIFIIISCLLITLLTSISADENQISNQGLIAYYSFDEGNGEILHDLSGNNHNGTIYGGIWTDGISGKALEFNGINTYVSLPTSTLGNWNSLTYSFWVKAPKYSGSGWPSFFGSYTTSFTYNTCIAISRNTETIHIEIDTDTGNYETKGEIKIPWDTWFHAALVYDGAHLTEYINGVRGTSIPATGNLKNVSELNIGQLGNGMYFFNGLIDEAYIYDRALSPTEIQQLFNHAMTSASLTFFKDNNAIEKSPLNGVVPRETVPIVATAVSITSLILWQLFGGIIVDFFSDYTSEKLIDAKGNDKAYIKRLDKIKIPRMPLKTSELFNIFIAVAVFSFALSWTWGSTIWGIIFLFILNLFIVGFIYIFRELFRIYYSGKLGLKTDHVLWPFGAVVTVISSLLGNTFSLAAYNTAENESDGRYAKLLLRSTFIFYFIALVCYLFNFIFPNVIFQMIFIFIIMSLMIDMTPIKPMDGDIVRRWNIGFFASTYAIIIASYILMIFTTL